MAEAPFTVSTDFPLRDKDASNAITNTQQPRHNWYYIKESFSKQFVEHAIRFERLEPLDVLLDPFSGSGTAAVVGTSLGLRSVAYEVNPFLHHLSSAKLSTVTEAEFSRYFFSVLAATESPIASPLEGYSTFTRGNRWNRWLFPTSVLRAFEAGKAAALRTPTQVRKLLMVALIGAAMDCCNAVRDGKCLRYPTTWREQESTAADLSRAFYSRGVAIAHDLDTTALPSTRSQLFLGDSRHLIRNARHPRFRLCITSPPYLNSFDYSDVYRPELFLGGFVKSNAQLMKIRLQTIRSHIQARWEHPYHNDFGSIYHDTLTDLHNSKATLWSDRIPSMIQAYFEDMDHLLRDLRVRALDNASLWLVVSTSAYGGVEIPVDFILAQIAQRRNWSLREVALLRHLRSSSQHVAKSSASRISSVQLRESLVILDAS